jgi:hypothetical protein
MLSFISLIILIVIFLLLLYLLIWLCKLPGSIAKKRNHPQQEAISICSWMGLLTAGVCWIIAFIWAYTKPPISNLEERLLKIEDELKRKGK